ncbi:MAG: thioredoxin family protein [Bacteroidales bacterium]|nr:TM0996/MTH895 family glutaredoxin-like protein [Lentimicrobiaceae bacterium]MDD5695042.1 thioredoxin family protein [Bacteroidales bacterium]
MEIKVLGTGCPKCKSLEKNVREAVDELGIKAEITKVEDIIEIIGYGIISTPGLIMDNKIVSSGHLLSVNQVKEIIRKNQEI